MLRGLPLRRPRPPAPAPLAAPLRASGAGERRCLRGGGLGSAAAAAAAAVGAWSGDRFPAARLLAGAGDGERLEDEVSDPELEVWEPEEPEEELLGVAESWRLRPPFCCGSSATASVAAAAAAFAADAAAAAAGVAGEAPRGAQRSGVGDCPPLGGLLGLRE